MDIRTLRADEIEVRPASVFDNGCSLLLYKDARADMIILDETFKPENWQRNHELINGNLFCNVGIKIDGEWVWKQDVGVESYTEKEKGQASDAFKRACVNWGIGRELYTSPFIWVKKENLEFDNKGKLKSKFKVAAIGYDDKRNINQLIIEDSHGNMVFSMGSNKAANSAKGRNTKPQDEKPVNEPQKGIGEEMALIVDAMCKSAGVDIPQLLINKGIKSFAELTDEQYSVLVRQLQAAINKKEGK